MSDWTLIDWAIVTTVTIGGFGIGAAIAAGILWLLAPLRVRFIDWIMRRWP